MSVSEGSDLATPDPVLDTIVLLNLAVEHWCCPSLSVGLFGLYREKAFSFFGELYCLRRFRLLVPAHPVADETPHLPS